MKIFLIFLTIALGLASCSAPKLYQQGLNKIEKAIQKDSTLVFPTDTLTKIQYDTIPGVDGKDSIIKITETVQLPCDFDVDDFMESVNKKTGRQLRFERKTYKDSLKHQEKMYKLETNRLQDSLNFQKKLNKELTKRLDDQTDTEVKLAKEDTKQQKGSWFQRQMGKIWWLLLIIGLVLGLFVKSWIPKIPNPFKQRKDAG
jgi:hypothetical protein